jgi:hypothetical protein
LYNLSQGTDEAIIQISGCFHPVPKMEVNDNRCITKKKKTNGKLIRD